MTTRSTAAEAPFLAAIRADLESDTPRLIFADWLEERGDPRAQLIRVQCEQANNPAGGRLVELREQERLLLAQYEQQWLAELPRLHGVTYGRGALQPAFHRGFVEEATLRSCKAVLRAEPLMTETIVHRMNLRLDEARRVPEWTVLRGMVVLKAEGPGAAAVLQAPDLSALRSLKIVSDEQCDFDPTAPALPNLRTLRLINSPIGNTGLGRLGEWPGLASVEELELSGTQALNVGLRALVESPSVANLTRLALGEIPMEDTGLAILADSPYLGRLRELTCLDCALTPRLEGLDRLPQLTALCLDGNPLRVVGAQHLAESVPQGLRQLSLAWAGVGDAGVAALLRSSRLTKLESLMLPYSDITDVGGSALVETAALPKLTHLELYGNQLSDRMRKRLEERFGKGFIG